MHFFAVKWIARNPPLSSARCNRIYPVRGHGVFILLPFMPAV